MSKKFFVAQRVSGLANPKIPAVMAREVGRVMVRWAHFELFIQEMIWVMLGVSPAAGRIAVREPRVTDRLQMLNELRQLRKATWDDELYKSVLARAGLLVAKRDLLAHGMWGYLKTEHEWHVQLARGSWPKNVRDLVEGSKRVTPEGVPMNTEKLREAVREIDKLIADLKKLRLSAEGPPAPWQETPP